MSTIKIVLDNRRPKKTGLYPLVIRFRHKKSSFELSTGYTLRQADFDPVKERIKGDPQQTRELQRLKTTVHRKFLQMLEEGASFATIKSVILQKDKKEAPAVTMEQFWSEEIKRLTMSGRAGGARVYQSSLGGLRKVMSLLRPFSELSLQDLLTAEAELRQHGVSLNSVGVYMRTLRAICNRAIALDLVPQNWYPFKRYKIRKTKTVPRSLNVPELQSFFKMDLHPEENLYPALQIGKLIFLLRGINLRDLLCLTEQSLSQGRIVYRRSKTGKLYNINVHMAALTPLHWLISKEGHKRITKREIENLDTDLSAVKKYVQFRKVINAHLRSLGCLTSNQSEPF